MSFVIVDTELEVIDFGLYIVRQEVAVFINEI